MLLTSTAESLVKICRPNADLIPHKVGKFMPTNFRVSPSGGRLRGDPPTTRKIGLSPHATPIVLTQKCRFCNFHAVFGHFAQIVPPTSRPQLGNPVFFSWAVMVNLFCFSYYAIRIYYKLA